MDSEIYDFPLGVETRRVSTSHLTTQHGVCYSNACPHWAVRKGFPLSLTQTAVVLQELSSVIPEKISVAKKWWADWHLSAGSWFNTLTVVSHFEEMSGKHMGFVCVCTCLSWISAVKSLALWRANHLILTLSCYFKAFSWPAQRKFQKVPIVLLARAPSEGMLVGSFFFAVRWPATGTLGVQAWLKAQPFWGRVLVYKIRLLQHKSKMSVYSFFFFCF